MYSNKFFDIHKSNYVTDNLPQIFQNIRDETKKPITKINYHNFYNGIDKSSYDLIHPEITKVDRTLLSITMNLFLHGNPLVLLGDLSLDEIASFYKLFFVLPLLKNPKLSPLDTIDWKKYPSTDSQNLLTPHLGSVVLAKDSNSKRIDEVLIPSISKLEKIISEHLAHETNHRHILWNIICNLLEPLPFDESGLCQPGASQGSFEKLFIQKVVSPLLEFFFMIGMFNTQNTDILFTKRAIPVQLQTGNFRSLESGYVVPGITINVWNEDSDEIRVIMGVKKPYLFNMMMTNPNNASEVLKDLFSYLYAANLNVGLITDYYHIGVFMLEEPLTDIVKPKIGPPPKPSILNHLSHKYFDLTEIYEETPQASDYVSGQLMLATLILGLWPDNLQVVDSSSKKVDNLLTSQQQQLLENFIITDDIELWRTEPTQSHSNNPNDLPVDIESINICDTTALEETNSNRLRIKFELLSKGGFYSPQEVILVTKEEFLNSGIYEAGEFEVSKESLPDEVVVKIYDENLINQYIIEDMKERSIPENMSRAIDEDFPTYEGERLLEVYKDGYNNELASYRRINTYNNENNGPHINTADLLGSGYLSNMNRYRSAKFIALSKLEHVDEKPKTKEEFNLGVEQIKLINSLHIKHNDLEMKNICFDRADQKFFIFDFSLSERAGGCGLDESRELMALYDPKSEKD